MEAGNARLFIDAGLSLKETRRRLQLEGESRDGADALIITHEHSDHIKGAGTLARALDLPVFLNKATYRAGKRLLGRLPRPKIIQTGESFEIKGVRVETFAQCHDAADPMGLVISHRGIRLGVCTDLGRRTLLARERLKGCHALVLEFNHDPVMLAEGPYPPFLKQRIKGPDGHLSNQEAGELLADLAHSQLQVLVLAHLSRTNNTEHKALEVARGVLGGAVHLVVARQHEPTQYLDLEST